MIKVNEKCIGCGLCIKDCICGVIAFDDNKKPYEKNPNNCIKCQHCMAVCPTGALSIDGKNPQNSKPVSTHNPEEILNLIKDRRSFRQYKQENIAPEIMNKLKNMLNWVPSGVNNHRLFFAFIDDINVMKNVKATTKQKMRELFDKNDPSVNGFIGFKDGILDEETDMMFRKAPHMLFVATPIDAPCSDIDPIIALSYFELYAQSLNVATCWCGIGYWVYSAIPELQKMLKIPEGYRLAYTMLFGNPAVEYKRSIQPEPLQIISVK